MPLARSLARGLAAIAVAIVAFAIFVIRQRNRDMHAKMRASMTASGNNPVAAARRPRTWKTRPRRVIMFRHGEKNKEPRNGCKEDPDLNEAGIARARQLPTYFSVNMPGGMSPETVVYAQAVECKCESTRPIYTVAPLARALFSEAADPVAVSRLNGHDMVIPEDEMLSGTNRVPADAVFTKHRQFVTRFPNTKAGRAALGEFVRTDPVNNGRDVVICWEHENLPHVAAELFAGAPPLYYNDDDPLRGPTADVFDRVWVFEPVGDRVRFTVMPSFKTHDPSRPTCLARDIQSGAMLVANDAGSYVRDITPLQYSKPLFSMVFAA